MDFLGVLLSWSGSETSSYCKEGPTRKVGKVHKQVTLVNHVGSPKVWSLGTNRYSTELLIVDHGFAVR